MFSRQVPDQEILMRADVILPMALASPYTERRQGAAEIRVDHKVTHHVFP